MSHRDTGHVAATNTERTLSLTFSMHDPETGEARTAVVTLDKQQLWQTADGRVVRGVVVRWKGAGE